MTDRQIVEGLARIFGVGEDGALFYAPMESCTRDYLPDGIEKAFRPYVEVDEIRRAGEQIPA